MNYHISSNFYENFLNSYQKLVSLHFVPLCIFMCLFKIPAEKISHHIPRNFELALMIFLHVHYQGTSKQTHNITKLPYLHFLGLNLLCTVMWIFKAPLKLIKSSHFFLQSSVCFPMHFHVCFQYANSKSLCATFLTIFKISLSMIFLRVYYQGASIQKHSITQLPCFHFLGL